MASGKMGIIVFLLCFCLCLLPYSIQAVSTADAADPISAETECTLTISCICDTEAFADIPVKLYRIADASEKAEYTPTPKFLSTGLILNGIQSAAEWNVIRSTLEAHILANTAEADFSSVTNPEGLVCFASLKPGLYLAIPGHVIQNGQKYFFDSALIALPGLTEDGFWQYQITVTPKSEILPLPEQDAPDVQKQFKVLKLWKDDSNQTERPSRIEIEIFRDGNSAQTVALSEENHWSYTWSGDADGTEWMVVERNIPAGYTVTVEERGETFILTNKLLPTDPPGDIHPTDAPQTGDTSHILFYITLMYLSGLGLILFGISGKKNRV